MRILPAAAVFAGWLSLLATPAPAAARAALSLRECRLQHPLRLDSVEARCGWLRVAENRAAPQAGTIALRFAVVPALDRDSRAAPLFLLAGGPGQSAIDMYVETAGAFAEIHRDHDIVMLDQRGTGRSAPLNCAYPDDWSGGADALAEVRRATRACLAKYGERVRWYTTSAAVVDLDAARRALGYRQIDLYGASYGTRVAMQYMRHYGFAVHAAILDGVVDPERPLGADAPLYGERSLGLIVARCAASPDCALAFPRLAQELGALRRRFGPETVGVTLDDPTDGAPRNIVFSRGVLAAALRFLSYSGTEASLLPLLIHQAAAGNLAPLAAQAIITARRIGGQLASGMQMSVICSEDAPFFGAADLDRARLAKTYQGTDQLDAFAQICRIWPQGPVDADLHAPLRSSVPTLLLAGAADPVTPPAAARRVARGLANHRLLVLAGEGHGQLATGCVPRLMAQFLRIGSARRLDASCLARQRPPPFFLRFTGPGP